jgi:hypothetical protein
MDFDITMPLALFAVTAVAMLLNKRVEGKLKKTFEEKEFRTRDASLFVAMISVTVSVIVFVPQMAIMTIFLFSYSALLFTFSYLFSKMSKRKAQLFCLVFGVAGLAAGTVALLYPLADSLMLYGGWAIYGLSAFAFFAMLYEQKRAATRERWYLAVLPPILFVLLYLVYNGTSLWFPYLLNAYGVMFAILVTLYLGSLFSWKNVFIFAGLLTVMDIILVLFTGVMVTAAKTVSGLGLPVLISLPTLPWLITERGLQYMSLGLGDFFFSGILATQTYKKFGKKTAMLSAVTMSLSFGIFEAFLLSYQWGAFPGTLMIICGWLPVVAWKLLAERKTKNNNRNGRIELKIEGASLAE